MRRAQSAGVWFQSSAMLRAWAAGTSGSVRSIGMRDAEYAAGDTAPRSPPCCPPGPDIRLPRVQQPLELRDQVRAARRKIAAFSRVGPEIEQHQVVAIHQQLPLPGPHRELPAVGPAPEQLPLANRGRSAQAREDIDSVRTVT